MELYPGARVAGRYVVEQKVGEGSFGAVWSAKHIALGVRVALKTLLPVAAADDETVARFRREARLLAKIQSDYVVRVLDFVHDETFGLVLVLDFIEGELLFDVLRGRRMSVEETIDIGVDVLSGLADLHAVNVIHRDLKPGNILLRHLADGGQRAIIFDFSLSREDATNQESSLTDLTKSNVVMGTLPYMSPEQALNARQVTVRSDVYAVGAILYRMISGKQLFGDAGDALLRTKLTTDPPPLETGRTDRLARDFEEIVGRAIQRRPAHRFANAREMLTRLLELQRAIENESVSAGMRAAVSTDEEMVTELMETPLAVLRSSHAPRAVPAVVPEDSQMEPETMVRIPAGARGGGESKGATSRVVRVLMLGVAGAALAVAGVAVGGAWTARKVTDERAAQAAAAADAALASTASFDDGGLALAATSSDASLIGAAEDGQALGTNETGLGGATNGGDAAAVSTEAGSPLVGGADASPVRVVVRRPIAPVAAASAVESPPPTAPTRSDASTDLAAPQ